VDKDNPYSRCLIASATRKAHVHSNPHQRTAATDLAVADEYSLPQFQLMKTVAPANCRGLLFWKYDPNRDCCGFAGAVDPVGNPLRQPFCDVQLAMRDIDYNKLPAIARTHSRKK